MRNLLVIFGIGESMSYYGMSPFYGFVFRSGAMCRWRLMLGVWVMGCSVGGFFDAGTGRSMVYCPMCGKRISFDPYFEREVEYE